VTSNGQTHLIGPSLRINRPRELTVLASVKPEVDEIVAKYPNSRSATLPLLFLAQSVEGYVTEDGMRDVASVLGITPAEVLAVASFYTMFKKTPQGDYLISVCRNISCTHRGGRKVLGALEDRLGISAGQMTEDGKFSLEAAECLGTCDGAPALQINYEDFYNVSPDDAVGFVDSIERGDAVTSVAGEPVRTAKEIARETALAGTASARGLSGGTEHAGEMLTTVGGESPVSAPSERPRELGNEGASAAETAGPETGQPHGSSTQGGESE
jgi:NADH-quinone oxidoreductase subunit E